MSLVQLISPGTKGSSHLVSPWSQGHLVSPWPGVTKLMGWTNRTCSPVKPNSPLSTNTSIVIIRCKYTDEKCKHKHTSVPQAPKWFYLYFAITITITGALQSYNKKLWFTFHSFLLQCMQRLKQLQSMCWRFMAPHQNTHLVIYGWLYENTYSSQLVYKTVWKYLLGDICMDIWKFLFFTV